MAERRHVLEVALDHHGHRLIARAAKGEGTLVDVDLHRFPHNLVPFLLVAGGDALVIQGLELGCGAARQRLFALGAASLAPPALKRPGAVAAQRENPVRVGPDVQLGGMAVAEHVLGLGLAAAPLRLAEEVVDNRVDADGGQLFLELDVGVLGNNLAAPVARIEDQLEGLAAGQVAPAVAVLVGKAGRFKALGCQVGIVCGVGLLPGLVDSLSLGALEVPGLGG